MNKKTSTVLKLICALLIPTVISLIYCLIRGVSFKELYLPASYNNDCVFYYKLVESVARMGTPSGYFGFNESHALIGGFAAWSPLIVMPWALWGVLFGWTYSSVFVCNIVLFSLAFALFVYLSEADFKELGALFVLLLLFPSFTIHLLNALPEIILMALVCVFLGLAIRSAKRAPGTASIVVMFVVAAYLAMIRPYMVLLIFLPAYFLCKSQRKRAGIITGIFAAVLSFAGNVLIGHYFTSEYFTPLFDTEIIKLFLQGRFSEGFWMSVYVFKDMCAGMAEASLGAFSYGLTMGTQYVIAIVTAVFALVLAAKKGENKLRPIYAVFGVSTFSVLLAIVFLLRKVNEGGRHLWIFAVMGLFLCCQSGFKALGVTFKAVVAALLAVFVLRGAMVPTDYDIPIGDVETVRNVEYWQTVFDENVADESARGYDNTVIWVFVDYTEDSSVVTEYSELYALPEGMGISCCYPEYVIDNFDSLKSKYIVTDVRGKVSGLCESKGLKVVGRHENVIMYQRY